MSSELVQSWRNQILERQRADEELKRAILSKIESVRQTGMLISEARSSIIGEVVKLAEQDASDFPFSPR
jgi:hypothetical protein